jgi:CRISPR-associated exonuclease Cas4
MGIFLFFIISIALVWLGTRLLKQGSAKQEEAGLPLGRVIYDDSGAWSRVEEPFYDPLLRLTGKPDYLVAQGDSIIPVEVKSSNAPITPYQSHVYQLAAYCLLVEKATGKRPSHGILRYNNRTFSVDYTQQSEASLLDVLVEMRQMERRGDVKRSHEEPARCAACGYRSTCNQKI